MSVSVRRDCVAQHKKTLTIVAAITQQPLKTEQILQGGDDENLPYPCQHQCRDGIIDHRHVVDGQQLLAYSLGDGV